MSCGRHPQWLHPAEDCPMCAAERIDRQKLGDYLSKIRARYKDLDFADQIPRETMYFDIGVLCGRVERLEQELHEHGIKIP